MLCMLPLEAVSIRDVAWAMVESAQFANRHIVYKFDGIWLKAKPTDQPGGPEKEVEQIIQFYNNTRRRIRSEQERTMRLRGARGPLTFMSLVE